MKFKLICFIFLIFISCSVHSLESSIISSDFKIETFTLDRIEKGDINTDFIFDLKFSGCQPSSDIHVIGVYINSGDAGSDPTSGIVNIFSPVLYNKENIEPEMQKLIDLGISKYTQLSSENESSCNSSIKYTFSIGNDLFSSKTGKIYLFAVNYIKKPIEQNKANLIDGFYTKKKSGIDLYDSTFTSLKKKYTLLEKDIYKKNPTIGKEYVYDSKLYKPENSINNTQLIDDVYFKFFDFDYSANSKNRFLFGILIDNPNLTFIPENKQSDYKSIDIDLSARKTNTTEINNETELLTSLNIISYNKINTSINNPKDGFICTRKDLCYFNKNINLEDTGFKLTISNLDPTLPNPKLVFYSNLLIGDYKKDAFNKLYTYTTHVLDTTFKISLSGDKPYQVNKVSSEQMEFSLSGKLDFPRYLSFAQVSDSNLTLPQIIYFIPLDTDDYSDVLLYNINRKICSFYNDSNSCLIDYIPEIQSLPSSVSEPLSTKDILNQIDTLEKKRLQSTTTVPVLIVPEPKPEVINEIEINPITEEYLDFLTLKYKNKYRFEKPCMLDITEIPNDIGVPSIKEVSLSSCNLYKQEPCSIYLDYDFDDVLDPNCDIYILDDLEELDEDGTDDSVENISETKNITVPTNNTLNEAEPCIPSKETIVSTEDGVAPAVICEPIINIDTSEVEWPDPEKIEIENIDIIPPEDFIISKNSIELEKNDKLEPLAPEVPAQNSCQATILNNRKNLSIFSLSSNLHLSKNKDINNTSYLNILNGTNFKLPNDSDFNKFNNIVFSISKVYGLSEEEISQFWAILAQESTFGTNTIYSANIGIAQIEYSTWFKPTTYPQELDTYLRLFLLSKDYLVAPEFAPLKPILKDAGFDPVKFNRLATAIVREYHDWNAATKLQQDSLSKTTLGYTKKDVVDLISVVYAGSIYSSYRDRVSNRGINIPVAGFSNYNDKSSYNAFFAISYRYSSSSKITFKNNTTYVVGKISEGKLIYEGAYIVTKKIYFYELYKKLYCSKNKILLDSYSNYYLNNTYQGISNIKPENFRKYIVDKANTLIDKPYVSGGRNGIAKYNAGIDCVGLLYVTLFELGYLKENQNISKIFSFGGTILEYVGDEKFIINDSADYDKLVPGDFLFFNDYSHSGIYIGTKQKSVANGKGLVIEHLFIHASSYRRKVVIDSLETYRSNNKGNLIVARMNDLSFNSDVSTNISKYIQEIKYQGDTTWYPISKNIYPYK